MNLMARPCVVIDEERRVWLLGNSGPLATDQCVLSDRMNSSRSDPIATGQTGTGGSHDR